MTKKDFPKIMECRDLCMVEAALERITLTGQEMVA
jgi:hypothetical protein